MSNNIYIRPGGWVKNKIGAVKGALDLRKFVRDTLGLLNVPVSDPCCPTNTVGQPIRSTSVGIQTFNGTTWVLAAPQIVTVPLTANSAGIFGQIAIADGLLYVCTATGTDGHALWVRATLTTFP